jgi:hypothetical protein
MTPAERTEYYKKKDETFAKKYGFKMVSYEDIQRGKTENSEDV